MKKLYFILIVMISVLALSCQETSEGSSFATNDALVALAEVSNDNQTTIEESSGDASSLVSKAPVSTSIDIDEVVDGEGGGTLTISGSYDMSNGSFSGSNVYANYGFVTSDGQQVFIDGNETVSYSTTGEFTYDMENGTISGSISFESSMTGDLTITADGEVIPLVYDLELSMTISMLDGEMVIGEPAFTGTVNGEDAANFTF
jgi:hypothetical protein